MGKVKNKFTFPSLVAVVAVIIGIAGFAHPIADDFCLIEQQRHMSLFRILVHQYQTWDGRLFFMWFQAFFLGIPNGEYIAPYFYAASFVGVAYWLAAILVKDNFVGIDDHFKRLAFLSVLVGVWLANWSQLRTIVYWATGGAYAMSMAFTLGYLFFLLYGFRDYHPTSKGKEVLAGVGLCVLGLQVGGFGLQSFIPVATVVASDWLFRKGGNRKEFRFDSREGWIVLSLLCFLSTCIVTTIAPGNFVRANMTIKISVPHLVRNYFFVLGSFLRHGWLSVPLGFAVGAILGSQSCSFSSNKEGIRRYFPWALAIIVSPLPFSVIPNWVRDHTGIYLNYFLFILFAQIGISQGYRLRAVKPIHGFFRISSPLLVLIFFVAVASQVKPLYYSRRFLYQQARQIRSEIAQGKKEIMLLPNPHPDSALIYGDERAGLSPSSQGWQNLCYARYFGAENIREKGKE